jgi:hypothetical protein
VRKNFININLILKEKILFNSIKMNNNGNILLENNFPQRAIKIYILTIIFSFLYLLDVSFDYLINISRFSEDYGNLIWIYMIYFLFKITLEIIKVVLNGYYFYIELLLMVDIMLVDTELLYKLKIIYKFIKHN